MYKLYVLKVFVNYRIVCFEKILYVPYFLKDSIYMLIKSIKNKGNGLIKIYIKKY